MFSVTTAGGRLSRVHFFLADDQVRLEVACRFSSVYLYGSHWNRGRRDVRECVQYVYSWCASCGTTRFLAALLLPRTSCGVLSSKLV